MEISVFSGLPPSASEPSSRPTSRHATNEVIEKIIEGEWQEGDRTQTDWQWRHTSQRQSFHFTKAQAQYAADSRREQRALAAYQANIELAQHQNARTPRIDFFA